MIIAAWQEKVAPTDTVLNLGDLNIGRDSLLADILAQLPGYHILIRGNHDHHSPAWYERHGVHFVCDEIRRGEYLFTHEPRMELDSHTRANIFGHWHGDRHRYHEVSENPFYLANMHRYWHLHIEGTFAPVHFDDFVTERRGTLHRNELAEATA